jgi:hypothetical protein
MEELVQCFKRECTPIWGKGFALHHKMQFYNLVAQYRQMDQSAEMLCEFIVTMSKFVTLII